MNERGDDTTDSPPPPKTEPRGEREPGSYYYDDATGYDVYAPEADEDEEGSHAEEGGVPGSQ